MLSAQHEHWGSCAPMAGTPVLQLGLQMPADGPFLALSHAPACQPATAASPHVPCLCPRRAPVTALNLEGYGLAFLAVCW